MKERLQNSWLFYGLAVVWGAYPTVFMLGSHSLEGDVWSPLTAGFYGSILFVLLCSGRHENCLWQDWAFT